MTIINGTEIAQELLDAVRQRATPKRFFAGVLVGNDAASASFQILKQKTAQSLGIDYRIYEFPETINNETLREEIGRIARHRTCGASIHLARLRRTGEP